MKNLNVKFDLKIHADVGEFFKKVITSNKFKFNNLWKKF